MENRRIKRSVIYAIYGIIVVSLIGTIYLIEGSINNSGFESDDNYSYVSKTILDDTIPVVADVSIVRPYTDTEIKIVKSYYNYKDDEETQKNSLIIYENTYMPSSGVSYGGKDNFDVVAIKNGTVSKVTTDKLLGNIVQITHDDVVSLYQSLGEVLVKEGDIVSFGQKIGTSGTSNVENDLGSHIHFEIIKDGITINPEEYLNSNM